VLDADAVAVDVRDFEHLLDDATPRALARAVELYRGEFLEGFNPRAPAFEDWLMAERSRLRERALMAMQALLDQELANGATERAIRLALRLLALDPLRESVQRTLMELYARQGHYGAALKQYRVCQQVLRRELGIAPESATQQRYRQLLQHRQRAAAESPDDPAELPADEPPAAAPELRQATVLLIRFVPAETDPEARHEKLQRCHTIVAAEIQCYGGRPVQSLGDSVLAVFGLPAAHSNDAERAVRAAVVIRDVGLPVRIGIASGRVMASGDVEPTVTGAALDRATELAARAQAGQILLNAALHTSVAGRVDAESIAGEGETVWHLRALREPAPAERPAFVGRQGERWQFAAAVEACRETGCGQSLLVRGEAGIGKSRLLEECITLAEEQGFVCHKVLVLDFGAERDPVRTLIRSLLGLKPSDEENRVHGAAEQVLSDGLVDPDRRAELHDLLELPQPPALKTVFEALDNATRRERRQRLVIELVTACARRRPLLLAVEDIHWADAATLDYLARIAAAVGECPALLVMTHRVEGEPLDPAWRGAMHGAPLITIDLGPLRGEEIRALAAELATADDDFMRRCIERAGGNPLFLEQLLRSTANTDTVIPDSVRSIVWARLDRLGAADKRAAQAAAVLGQRFTLAALHRLLDEPDYEGKRLVEQRLVRPEGEDYRFSHALIREGIYDSLLASQRRELHRQAADGLRDRDPVLTAQHLDRAEAPEAARAYLQAARSQAQAYRYERARALLVRGLELARDDRERYALIQLQGSVLHAVGAIEDAIDAYRRAVELAADDDQRCQAWLGLAAGYSVKDRHADALAALDEAERLAGHRTRPLARLYSLRGNVLFPLGRTEDCLKAHRRARKYARDAGSPELEADALSGLGDADYLRGRMITAHGHFDCCVELCRRHGLARIEAANRPMRGFTSYFQNDLQAAYEDADPAVELAARIGHLRAETVARDVLFYVLYARANWRAAREQAEWGLELARRLGAQRFEADFRLNLALVLLAEGERATAEQHLDEAYAFSRAASLAFAGPWILGALASATDDADKRRRALAEGEALLAADSISHSYLNFYQLAIDAALADADWQAVARYCTALADYTRPEPLPWSDFFIARGRALAAWKSGQHEISTRRELRRLADEAERVGLRVALPALQAALAES
ncbi:MAG: BTAD domain-containing putative transcriptional regulator, partial [Candidatus Competibacterales bacterium]|nr:BTAD domain-containing putative transcriptional regulator [Candidatus Competibacterales bacterium]